jgi:hypothetical protein
VYSPLQWEAWQREYSQIGFLHWRIKNNNEGMKMENEIITIDGENGVTIQKYEVAQQSSDSSMIMRIIDRAMSMPDFDPDKLMKLMDAKERFDATEAKKAYVAAMAEFKRNPPEIFKTKQVGYTNKDGTFTGYKHATLGDVTTAIIKGLADNGFSHRWDTEQRDNAQIYVTCVLTHKLGHSESTTLNSSRDDSGKKNNIQQMASAINYLQRYTLLAATGLATQDAQDDDDGAGAEPKQEQDRPAINDKNFAKAMQAIRDKTYTAEEMRNYYGLTSAQESSLTKEFGKAA